MPLLGVVFYFSKSPRFLAEDLIHAKLFSTVLLTILLPILIFSYLNFKKVDTIYLKSTNERKLPLLLNAVIITLVLLRVFTPEEIPELYFFFWVCLYLHYPALY
jgi:hypothetical protein